MKNTLKMVEDKVYLSSNEQGHECVIDMRSPEVKKNQSPMELLLSALSTCSAVDIVLILKKKKKTVTGFTVETEGTQQAETPKSFSAIHCHYRAYSPDTGEDELNKIANMAIEKYCSVASSLKARITFSVEVVK